MKRITKPYVHDRRITNLAVLKLHLSGKPVSKIQNRIAKYKEHKGGILVFFVGKRLKIRVDVTKK